MKTKLLSIFLVIVLGGGLYLKTKSNFTQISNNHNNEQTQEQNTESPTSKKSIDAGEIIFDHVLDAHEFHFIDIKNHPISIPLPLIIYSPQRGINIFSYSRFEHGTVSYKGYAVQHGKIIAVDTEGQEDKSIQFYDLSLSKNVVQLLLNSLLLLLIMFYVVKVYKKIGTTKAPKGLANFVEIIILFIRDDIAKPNLANAYIKYFPFLLTVFFFILINNIVGLIPTAGNVSGNIAFTIVLGIVSFLVIMFSTKKHYWHHIFAPPVHWSMWIILIPVEILGIFTKPFALILRLFANMLAGHIAIICFILLIFIIGSIKQAAGYAFAPFSVFLVVFMYALEIVVAFLQAYIFTTLTAVFIGQAREH